MKHNVVAPSVGESITEVSILKWAKESGQAVKPGDLLLEIESDKATVEVVAEHAGVLRHVKPVGERVGIGAVIGEIDTDGKATVAASGPAPQPTASASVASASAGSTTPMPGPAARKLAEEQGKDWSTLTGSGKDGRVTKGDLLATSASPAAQAPAAPRPPQAADRPGDRRVPMSMLR